MATTVEVPRPVRCDGARHEVTLALPRRVQVTAVAEGSPVRPARFEVNGERVDPESFVRAPGSYAYEAWHPLYGSAQGRFEVAECHAASCPPMALAVEFREVPAAARSGAARWSYITMGFGGLAVAGGLASGLAAFDTQRQIDGYTNRRDEGVGIDDLVERRDQQATVADTLVVAGTSALFAGLVWYWATSR